MHTTLCKKESSQHSHDLFFVLCENNLVPGTSIDCPFVFDMSRLFEFGASGFFIVDTSVGLIGQIISSPVSAKKFNRI